MTRLADIRNAKAIKSLHLYWKLCQNSIEFFP